MPPDAPSPPRAVGTGSRAPKRTAIEHPGRFAIVAVGLTLVVVLIAVAITSADTSEVKRVLPAQVTSVSPQPNAIVPPQEQIDVDLRDDLIGDLTVCGPAANDCTPIPFDQVRFVKGLGQITFLPGPGKDLQSYPPGPVYVRIDYRSQADPTQDVGSFSWSFVSKS